MSNLGFGGTLIVATNGRVKSPEYGLSEQGVQETGFLIEQLSRHFLPKSADVLVATSSNDTHAYETATYFAQAYDVGILALPKLDEDRPYSAALEAAIIGDFIAHNASEFHGLIVVTTSILSSWLSGSLHARGQTSLNLTNSCAYITKSDGNVYIASKDGYRKR